MDILLVDDDEAVIESISRFLTARDHVVTAVSSADRAIASIETAAPDVVITDIQMPGMDGIELLERIRERERDLPVIIVTGYATVETAIQALRNRATDYLTKQVDLQALTTAMNRVGER